MAPPAPAWLAAFTLPVWPVTYCWSAYFYTTAAVGGAVLVAGAATRLRPWSFVALLMGLLWWHAAVSAAPTFAVANDPWTPTSHLTNGYFERGAALTGKLRAALRRVDPRPGPRTMPGVGENSRKNQRQEQTRAPQPGV